MNAFTRILSSLLFFSLAATCVAEETQTKTESGTVRRFQFDADKAFIIREIGAVITEEKGIMKIAMIPPSRARAQELQDLDLNVGDEVGMAGGKGVKTIKELKDAYEKAAVGEGFKLGVRRDGQAHIVTFVKKAEKDMPQGGRMVIRQSGSGGDENSDFFPAFGIGVVKKGTDILISEVLPNAPKNLKKGDIIKTLNGKEIKTIADFNKEFDATKVGATLTLELLRDGKQVIVAAPRPEPKGQMIIKRN